MPMNPVLVILVLTGAVLLWFMMSFAFIPIGKIIYRIWKNAVDKIDTKEKNDKEEI